MEDKIQRLVNAANSTNATAKEFGMKGLQELGLDNNGNPLKSATTKEPKPKAERKKREPKAKAEVKSGTPYNCDDLIEQAEQRKAKAKANAVKRANEPKKTQATKNVEAVDKTAERIEKNVEKRVVKGDVSVAEIDKIIAEYETALKKLRALREKATSKMAKGGGVDAEEVEHILMKAQGVKEHHCGCGDKKMAKGGGIGGQTWTIRDNDDSSVGSYLDEAKLIAWAKSFAKQNGENPKINSSKEAIAYIERRDKNGEQDFEVYENYAKGGFIGKQANLDRNNNGRIDSEDLRMIRDKKMATGGGVGEAHNYKNKPVMTIGIPFGYGKKQGILVDKLYKLLDEHNIDINNTKNWYTKGYGQEFTNDEDHHIVMININDAPNPKKFAEEIWKLDGEEFWVAAQSDSMAKGGNIKVGDRVKSTTFKGLSGTILSGSKDKDYWFVRMDETQPNGDWKHEVFRKDEVEKIGKNDLMANGGGVKPMLVPTGDSNYKVINDKWMVVGIRKEDAKPLPDWKQKGMGKSAYNDRLRLKEINERAFTSKERAEEFIKEQEIEKYFTNIKVVPFIESKRNSMSAGNQTKRYGRGQYETMANGGGVGKSGFAIMQRGDLRTDAYGRVEFFATKEKALFKMSHVPLFKPLSKDEKLKLIVPYEI